jgi:hypothetical protein
MNVDYVWWIDEKLPLAPSADRFSGGLPVLAIHIHLSDGFDHDDVVLHVGVPAASAQKKIL